MWPLSNITSAQNRTNTSHQMRQPQQQRLPPTPPTPQRINNTIATTANPLFCQVVGGCVNQPYDYTRSQSPTVTKRDLHCFTNSKAVTSSSTTTSTNDEEVELIYSYKLTKMTNNSKHVGGSSNSNKGDRSNDTTSSSKKKLKSSSTLSLIATPATARMKKSIIKTYDSYGNIDAINTLRKKSTIGSSGKKTVSFDLIEVREHPRILGDNPSAKRGPPLSIGWYEPSGGRILRYSVDEYERRRNNGNDPNHPSGGDVKKRSVEIISPTERQRMLLQDVGVTPSEIFAARKEVSKIRKSRRDHNVLVNYDETVVVLEQCINTVQRLLSYSGTSSECEFQALMEQAERSKQQQQRLLLLQQQQKQEQHQRLYEKVKRHDQQQQQQQPLRIYQPLVQQ